jgi:hypothetical protein
MRRLKNDNERVGAEFLVMGLMLVENIMCHKSYFNFPGFDLVALNPRKNKSVKIQVKSRWATDSDRRILMKNFDSDFVAFVQLNRGYRYSKKHLRRRSNDGGKLAPEVYIFPTRVVRAARIRNSSWGKINLKGIPRFDEYKEDWGSIRKALALTDGQRPSASGVKK